MSARVIWFRALALPALLHLVLCLGVYQLGFSNAEMRALRIDGPSHLIDAYVKAEHRYGPLGVLRAYLRGESDERLYLEYSNLLLHGHADMAYIADRQNDPRVNVALPKRAFPYRDVRLEYPPLSFLAMLPPALVSVEYSAYRSGFIIYMLLVHFLNLWLGWRLLSPQLMAAEPLEARSRIAARVLWYSLAFFAALGTLVVTRMDHLVVTWVLLSLLAFERAERSTGRARLRWAAACGALAGFGVLTKIVPGLCVLAAIALWLRSDARDRFRCVLACSAALGLVVVGVNTAFYAWAGERYLETYRYHALRGVQIESLYSGLLMLLKPFGLALRVDESFGSTNLASAATPIIKPLSLLLLATAIGYVLLRRRFSDDARGALALSVILLLLFMLTNRVFSPQYTIWVAAPLALLAVLSPESRRQYGAFVALALLSQLIFPRGYPVLKALHPVAIALLNLRNLGLVALCVSLVRAHSTPVAQSLFNR
jgi:4-amino-4-deoxy-L-arabinose transferase-like glycosyltransferase